VCLPTRRVWSGNPFIFFGQCEFYKLLMFSNWRNSLFEGPQILGGKGLEMLNLFVLRSSSSLQIFNVGRHKIHVPKFGQTLTWTREALSSKSMSSFGRWQFLSDWDSWMGEALTGEDLNLWGVWTLGEVNFNFFELLKLDKLSLAELSTSGRHIRFQKFF
jgi:hypothetical protein